MLERPTKRGSWLSDSVRLISHLSIYTKEYKKVSYESNVCFRKDNRSPKIIIFSGNYTINVEISFQKNYKNCKYNKILVR